MPIWKATETTDKRIFVSQSIIFPFSKNARVFWTGSVDDFPGLAEAVKAARVVEPWHDWDNYSRMGLDFSCQARTKRALATTKKPTKPGYYWLQTFHTNLATNERCSSTQEIVFVGQMNFQKKLRTMVVGFTWKGELNKMADGFEWIGPLENPFEVK